MRMVISVVFLVGALVCVVGAFKMNGFAWGPAAVNKEYRAPSRTERAVVLGCGILCGVIGVVLWTHA